MTSEIFLLCLGVAVTVTAAFFIVVVLFAYALAIWDTYTEKRRP